MAARRPVPRHSVGQALLSLTALLSVFTGVGLDAEPGGGRWAYILPSTLQHSSKTSQFDRLAITGFVLEEDGSLAWPALPVGPSPHLPEPPLRTPPLTQRLPVVAFRSPAVGHTILHSPEARSRALHELTRLAAKFGRMHLDLEGPDRQDARMLGLFLSLLHGQLRPRQQELSLAVFPPNSPLPEAAFHDLALLSPHADAFVLMTYDLHRPSTEPGPVTDLDWAARAVSRALVHVRADRLWLGVPAYGYEWTRGGRYRTLTAPLVYHLLGTPGLLSRRDPSGCLYLEWRPTVGPDRGLMRQAWFPDQELRRGFEELARRHGLAGTALWRPEFDWPQPGSRAKKRPQSGR